MNELPPMPTPPKRAALWLRVSTEEQSLENQERVLRGWAAARGLELTEIYRVQESAWKGRHLPMLDGVVQSARLGRFQVLLVWALDRLSRGGPLRTLELVERLEQAGCQVWSWRESWTKEQGPMRELLLALYGWIGEQESRRISERTKAGNARRKAQGLPLGRQPGAKDKRKRHRRSTS